MRRPLQSLEEALGRSLSPDDRGSVATLNDLQDERIAEARDLARGSRVATVEYLRFYVEGAELDAIAGFIDEVLREEKVTASEWGKRDVLCYAGSDVRRLCVHEEAALLAPLDDVEGERWKRMVPAREAWDWSGLAGAPGVLVRSAPYWFEPPQGVEMGDLDAGDLPLEPVPREGLPIALRRWVASRIAWSLRRRDRAATATLESVCAELRVDPEHLSSARAAIHGLLRSGWPHSAGTAVPGFDGPDDWYR